uniref:Protein MIZU-KUSSEI 1 n=1 Tax=Kalanchoe fedtschenkoi TaxID=63787 RepID=A0A7N0TCA9_KALFE
MQYVNCSPYLQMDNPALVNLLKLSTTEKRSRPGSSTGIKGLLHMFKLLPMLSSGCKMVALLGRPRRGSLPDRATTGTIFGYRTGKVTLAIQENPNAAPMFVMELPMTTAAFQKEAESETLRIALESESRTSKKKKNKKKLMEEAVWGVYCNGRKMGYSLRRSSSSSMSEDDVYVLRRLRGVSMGAGVLPPLDEREGEMTYFRMRFERGLTESEDSHALYMINPEGGGEADTEFSIFFLRSGSHTHPRYT